MNKKFIVQLSVEERSRLEVIVAKGKAAARKLTRWDRSAKWGQFRST